jgi:hypothetical protein
LSGLWGGSPVPSATLALFRPMRRFRSGLTRIVSDPLNNLTRKEPTERQGDGLKRVAWVLHSHSGSTALSTEEQAIPLCATSHTPLPAVPFPHKMIKRFEQEKAKPLLLTAALVWVILLVSGMAIFMRSANSAGAAATAPLDWPAASRIERSTAGATLVVLAHPHCPCTRATINELAKVMARLDGKLPAYVIFTKPEGVEEDWEKTDTWASAAQIPGVRVVSDERGEETQLFGARTSGQAMLYDHTGKLLFSGGITVGRGLEGTAPGRMRSFRW